MDPVTIAAAFSLLQSLGVFDFLESKQPLLKTEGGGWLPMYYTRHVRADANDLDRIWIDEYTICDENTGVPLARWNHNDNYLQQVKGFTLQGFPVYEDVGAEHPVWSTVRSGAPEKYSSPGRNFNVTAHKGRDMWNNSQQRREYYVLTGDKLAETLGYYGPLDMPVGETPETGDTPPVQNIGPGLLTIGGIVALAMGATVPGALALGAGILLNRGTPQTPQRSQGGPGVGGTTPGGGNITQGRG